MNRMLLNNSTTSAMLQRVSGAAGTTPQCKALERHVAASSHVVRRWKSLFERSKSYAAATSSASLKRNSVERGHSRSDGVAGFLSTTRKTTIKGSSSTAGYYRRFSTAQLVNAAKAGTSTMPSKCLHVDNINPNFISMEYAVRGPLVIRAGEIEKELKEGVKKPFDQVIRANIGDCHAMGQQPITFVRQLLALTMEPRLLNSPDYPEDVKQRAKVVLEGCQGGSVGSYTDSAGLEVVRRQVAQFIEERDCLPSDWHNIFLTAGATPGIKSIISLMRCKVDGKKPGIMVPIPQYPLYSATIEEYGMARIGYYLEEESNWSLSRCELQRSFDEASTNYNPRALVVINPGNPTGQVLSRDNIEEIIRFAYDNRLVLLADEVYQANVYDAKSKFFSFKSVMNEMGAPYKNMELVSFLSASKGFLGECGIRGGYMEIVNMCPNVMAMLAKSITASLCATTAGQVAISALVNPPKQGEPSYELYIKEKTSVLNELKKRAELVYKSLSSFEGFKVNVVQGAMYVFPQIVIPKKAVEAAKAKKMAPDVFYAFELLESSGICIVPGSGFDQKPGTYHFRTTILPQTEQLKLMMNKFQQFHSDFMRKYK